MTRAAIALAALLCATPALARPIVIRSDMGGSIDQRLETITRAIRNGDHFEVRGPCVSACTMVLLDPHICATSRARFGFHGAYWNPSLEPSPSGTRLMLATYPGAVARWISRRGGLPDGSPTGPLLWLKAPEIFQFVRRCEDNA